MNKSQVNSIECLTVEGKTFKSAKALAEHYGLHASTVRRRLAAGWTLDETVGLKSPSSPHVPQSVEVHGKIFASRQDFADAFNIPRSSVSKKLNKGWTPEQIIGELPPPEERKPYTVFRGKTYYRLEDLAAEYSVHKGNLSRRLRAGWTYEQALELEPRKRPPCGTTKSVKYKGKNYPSLHALAEAFGLDPDTFRARLYRGYNLEQAVQGDMKPRMGNRKGIVALGKKWESREALARAHGLDWKIVHKRLKRGWTMEQALEVEEAPPRFRNHEGHARNTKYKNLRKSKITGNFEPTPDFGGFKLYVITCSVNQKEYVGITFGPIDARLRQHFASARKGRKSALPNAIRKHGEGAFSIALIRNDARSYDELMRQEIDEIQKRDLIKNGYNSAVGGELGTAKELLVDGMRFPSRNSAAEFFGIDPGVFNLRLNRLGWTPEQAAGLVEVNWEGKSKQVKVNGVAFASLSQACKYFGIPYQKFHRRVKKQKWTVEQALEVEPPPQNQNYQLVFNSRQYGSISELAKELGLKAGTVAARLRKGYSPEDIQRPVKADKSEK